VYRKEGRTLVLHVMACHTFSYKKTTLTRWPPKQDLSGLLLTIVNTCSSYNALFSN